MDNNQNYIFHQKYEIKKKLGEGGFGSVFKVLNKEDNNYYAIKQVSIKGMNKSQIDFIKKEAKILSIIKNDYIVEYYDSFIENDTFNIVMEFCDLMDFRFLINEAKRRNIYIDGIIIFYFVKQICLGLKEIHEKNLIHRDLKPDNIFITSDIKVKIGDFGIAKQLGNKNDKTKTQIGTLLYMAPEIIKGEYYNYKVDIWALGCIIYELCTLNYYYEKKNTKINISIYGEKLQNLIDILLNEDYNKRPNANQIIEFIEKAFDEKDMQKINVELVKKGFNLNFMIEKSINIYLEQIEENNST